MEISNDAIAVSAANLVAAIVSAQGAASQLEGLSEAGAERHIFDLFAKCRMHVRQALKQDADEAAAAAQRSNREWIDSMDRF